MLFVLAIGLTSTAQATPRYVIFMIGDGMGPEQVKAAGMYARAVYSDTWGTLYWNPGDHAVSHNVYRSESFDDVNDGTPGAPGFRGNQAFTFLVTGLPGFPYPDGLVPETTYYWRVDQSDGLNPTAKGDVWSFTTMGAGKGLKGEYYHHSGATPHDPAESAFETLVLTRIDPEVSFDWEYGSPDPSVDADNFSVKWTGEVEAAFTETYSFYANSDDGVMLWVNDQLLIDNWAGQSLTESVGEIDLVAGNRYSIVVYYYEKDSPAMAELRWSSASTPNQVIPQGALSPPAAAP